MLRPAAVAQIGDDIELYPNDHVAGRRGRRGTHKQVTDTVVWVQTFRPGQHTMSPIRDDYVARQVTTRSGSVWRGHPPNGRYAGPEIRGEFPSGVSFEHPWAAPLASHGGLPQFTLYANHPDWPEEGRDLGLYTTYDEAYRHAENWAKMLDAEVTVMLDGKMLAAYRKT